MPRKALLTSAFDDKLTKFINRVEEGAKEALLTSEQLAVATAALPAAAQLSAEFQPAFEKAASALAAALKDTQPMLKSALDGLRQRGLTPTNPVVIELPDAKSVAARLGTLKTSCEAVNAVIKQHADMVDTFTDHQAKAREAIRRHYIAANEKEFAEQTGGIATATTNVDAGQGALNSLNTEIADLRAKVQKHGPAAEKINKLVKSYLGHEELTIVPVVEGYELHRHSALAEGPPSEGEKGAIALCYFLSTLEAEDRKLKDLIVVIDDPVSSLDTKAMNFACTLIRNRLNDAAQLIVFTHNQHCMNEFKKGWKKRARPDDPTKDPTARLLYIDVTVPEATGTRTASIVELPKQLREYESEYHFLFQKVLELEAAGKGYFEYAFMMPNVLRRVLEIFLAFKEPHHGPLTDKLKAMSKRFAELDGDRLNALERLSQVESHSDNLDDLITQSSMTVEESRDANAALIFLMEKSDGDHLAGLRKYCKA